MKIHNISHLFYTRSQTRLKTKASTPLYRTMEDVFTYNQTGIKKINEITGVKFGVQGTQCDGSYPLVNFFRQFKDKTRKIELQTILQKGKSTNTDGVAYCLLKDAANVPLSTSGLYSCSVIYLFNKNNNKHLLYHVYHEMEPEELSGVIETFMPEKYTKASIIPGRNTFIYNYLQKIFKTLKSSVPDAPITVRHFSTPYPEIVGYKGEVFEIPNKKYLQGLKAGKLQSSGNGQATFKIVNLDTFIIFNEINNCNKLEDITYFKEIYSREAKYKTILPELLKLLNEREKSLKQIQKCTKLEER